MRRRVDDADERELGQVGRRHLGPRRAVVARHLHVTVVRARPEHAGLLRRFGKREDGGVPLRAVGLTGDRSPELPRRRIQVRRRLLERLGIGAREIGADHFPALALVARPVDHLRGDVERLRIVRRHHHREGPPEAEVDVGRAPAVVRLGVGRDVAHLLGAPVIAMQPVMIGRVDDVGVGGVRGDVAVLAAADGFPLLDRDAAMVGAARHRDGGVVLLGRVDAIRHLVVDGHVIELRRGLIEDRRPRLAAVEGDGRTAVVAFDHPQRVLRVDPQVVVVAVRHRHLRKGRAAVGRLEQVDVERPQHVGVLGVGEDMVVVPRPLREVGVVGEVDPGSHRRRRCGRCLDRRPPRR